jgi:hypothetical protein
MCYRTVGLVVLLAVAACGKASSYVVPEGFEGPVIIVYGDPEGSMPSSHREKLGVRSVYEIPSSGLLFVKERKPRGGGFSILTRENGSLVELEDDPPDPNRRALRYWYGGCLPSCKGRERSIGPDPLLWTLHERRILWERDEGRKKQRPRRSFTAEFKAGAVKLVLFIWY